MTTIGFSTSRPPAATGIPRALDTVIARASRAPSVHNTQPWRLTTYANGVLLHADRSRQLSVLDPDGRELLLGCGCLLFNLRVAAAAAGLHPRVHRFPDPNDLDLIAWMETDPAGRAVPDDALADLAPAMIRRHNNRRPYTPTPVPPDLAHALQAAAQAEDAVLTEVSRPAERAALAMLSQRADFLLTSDPAYRAELRAWLQNDPARTDGVPATTVPRVDAGAHEDVPIRDYDSHGHGALPVRTGADREQCLLLLSSEHDDARGWVRAGEALERVLLEITGYQVPAGSPPAAQWVSGMLSQAIEVPEIRAELRRLLHVPGQPMMVIRLGVAAPTPGTPRRPLADIRAEGQGRYQPA